MCGRHAAVQFGAARGGSDAGPADRRFLSACEGSWAAFFRPLCPERRLYLIMKIFAVVVKLDSAATHLARKVRAASVIVPCEIVAGNLKL